MTKEKFLQFKHECGTWIRTLEYLRQENIFLKNRLAEIVKTNIDSVFLKKLEEFQTKFLEKDTILLMLKQDITAQSDLLDNREDLAERKLFQQSVPKQYQLRDDMKHMEREYNKLKFEFNEYLSEHIL
jgi:hypothetical protein